MTLPVEAGHAHAVSTYVLSKRFDKVTALDEVELRVPDGSVYLLVGSNGAGKSTLFKVLMNLERPDTGAAEVFGLDTGQAGPEVRVRVGYVPDLERPPYAWMTCARLLRHVAAYFPEWDHAYAGHLTTVLGVPSEQKIGGLSKGQARRLQLILALAHRPALLLLDEPMDGLDPLVRRRALALLAEHLADTPTTVVIATHHIQELESLGDHFGVLQDGRLTAQMSREELRRTVRSYQFEVPEKWEVPHDLDAITLQRTRSGREVRCTVVGDEQDVTSRLAASGARLREVRAVPLEDAAVAFLSEEAP